MAYFLLKRLAKEHQLVREDWEELLTSPSSELMHDAQELAVQLREPIYGKNIFIRGLIEISNICHNDCYYCGIRRSNPNVSRFRLSADELMTCCENGHKFGFRTFVLQGGEDDFYTDDFLCPLLQKIHNNFPDCAITLSLGERSSASYRRLFDAGANRYLLRHETATAEHYAQLHPSWMSYTNRMLCLSDLKTLGYQVGAGFMVGSPGQTVAHLAADLCFLQNFRPAMIGIGPFISQQDTPFANEKNGSAEQTLYLLSLIRIMHPHVLLPATTALNTLLSNGSQRGMQAGANVVMPNLSPASCREKYALYDHKACTGIESIEGLELLKKQMAEIGYKVVIDRGDYQ